MAEEATKMATDRTDNGGLATEGMPSLADFAEEPGGAWPKGWYSATVIEGYSTNSGKQFSTTEEMSANGTSRNLFLALDLTNVGTSRKMRAMFNYRPDDFTPDRLRMVKELREQFRGTKGAWPGQGDAQRTSLAVAKLGQLEKAIGFGLRRSPVGNISPAPFVGQKLDVYLRIDDNGYNDVAQYAPAGSRTKGGK